MPLGYKGSYQRVRAYLHDKRTSPRSATAWPPSPRTVTGWILRRPETLTEPEQLQLKTVRAHCPELDALTRHVRVFATMPTERQGERLPDLLDAVRRGGLPRLHTLAAGIDRDLNAVTAGLTLPRGSGTVEGHVHRIKMLKRQLFGRGGSHFYANEGCSHDVAHQGIRIRSRGYAARQWAPTRSSRRLPARAR